MPQTTKPLIGRSAQTIWHEQNRQQLQSQKIVPTPDIVPRESTTGVGLFFARENGSGGGADVEKLIVSDYQNGDYLICRPWNQYYWQARRELFGELGGVAPDNTQLLTRINTLRAAADLEAWEASDLTEYL